MAAVTLAQAKVGMSDHIDQQVVEIIQRNSYLMDHLVFDDAVAMGTGGSTLTYGYLQLKTPAPANGRSINSDYTPAAAERETKFTNLQIMGASYQIDRVLAKNSNKFIDEVEFQQNQATKGTLARFQYLAINGAATNANEFDGLKTLLANTDNEIDGSTVDVSGTMTDAKAEALCEALDLAISSMDGKPDAIFCNSKMLIKINAAARKLNYNTRSEDAFGRSVDGYNGVPLVDLQQYYNGSATVDVIPVESKATNIYLVRFGLDGFHAVVPQGSSIGLEVRTPDFNQAGAVKTGDVEIVGAVVLKTTKAAAMLKGVIVEA